jgi:cell division protein FtsB
MVESPLSLRDWCLHPWNRRDDFARVLVVVVRSRTFTGNTMSEHTVKERMRAALGPELTAHIASLTAIIEATVPMVEQLRERVEVLEAEKARIEDTLSAAIAELAQRTDR